MLLLIFGTVNRITSMIPFDVNDVFDVIDELNKRPLRSADQFIQIIIMEKNILYEIQLQCVYTPYCFHEIHISIDMCSLQHYGSIEYEPVPDEWTKEILIRMMNKVGMIEIEQGIVE